MKRKRMIKRKGKLRLRIRKRIIKFREEEKAD